ncbi:DUF222 domain-containing protein [Arthrobacter sp. zg-Y820]|uniref:HNH endonuclease n=1 Tax=unclassified Arthrobacter TaxID=235627 RepID=UPI001E3560AB|nr:MULTISPECIES: HNH endonuclease signature motif containing protein [unclassified Arthrobacter]MCC9198237.1 DUF222 domain-containing protein [Arthrobacter sp. zg-Y820]MDK1281106.1 DUF222 domain-containing protein [Arthrobacter sp. zg.Y820]WIB10564.1 DUF222 domain-containing protein [Arthrobacter sp. zg-Y820]
MDTTTTFDQRTDPPPDAPWRDDFLVWEPQPPDPEWPPDSVPFDPLWVGDHGSAPPRADGGGDGCGPDGGGHHGAGGSNARANAGACGAGASPVFCADPAISAAQRHALAATLPEGFTGSLGLLDAAGLDQELTGTALQGVRILEGWAAAAKARLVHRQHRLMFEELEQFDRQRAAEDAERRAAGEDVAGTGTGTSARCARTARPGVSAGQGVDRSLAFSLCATEIATLFRLPEGTAMALVEESEELCTRCPDTLALLETGAITLAQARTILDQTRSLMEPAPVAAAGSEAGRDPGKGPQGEDTGPENDKGQENDQPGVDDGRLFPPGAAAALEQDLLQLAPELTNAQLTRKARRLRERIYPQSIPVRHRTAFDQRRVWFQPRPDGMGHLTAYMPADKGQQIYGALTGAARGEQAQGDPRCLDQLRTDILASLLLHTPEPWIGEPGNGQSPDPAAGEASTTDTNHGSGRDSSPDEASRPAGFSGLNGSSGFNRADGANGPNGPNGSADAGDLPPLPPATVAEIMVLINADTLFGADDAPAELAGYGPITAEAARRLARAACRWTGLVQDPCSGQVLGVGRRRKVPAGLRRWLQARDQTCRFPGCSAGTGRAEADHTIPWAAGGPTAHWNLAHLCKKHHLFKTLGFWKARQVTPGVLEWISPLGRHYTTQPELTLTPQHRLDSGPSVSSRPAAKRVPLSVVFSGGGDSGKDGGEPPPF